MFTLSAAYLKRINCILAYIVHTETYIGQPLVGRSRIIATICNDQIWRMPDTSYLQ